MKISHKHTLVLLFGLITCAVFASSMDQAYNGVVRVEQLTDSRIC